MSSFPRPIPRDALWPLLGDVPRGVFSEEFTAACEALDVFVGDCLRFLVASLALEGFSGTPETLAETQGYSSHGRSLVRWLLECLELYGLASCQERVFSVNVEGCPVDLGRSLEEAVAASPGAEAAFAVQKLATEALPGVLAGTMTGEEALFSLRQLDLWFRYFANSNVHYAPTNRLAALALSQALGPGARILELGGGGGSAAEAALQALVAAGKPPGRYVFTEIHPAFLRRGSRVVRQVLPEGCELAVRSYDINLPPAHQGFGGERFDAVFAVNVLHLANDPVAALSHLRTLLAPGGVLVLGELIRPDFLAPVHLELPFLLLESYHRARTLDGIRARPGFLCLSGWRRALEAAGLTHVQVLPAELSRCFELYPGFYCAALLARESGKPTTR